VSDENLSKRERQKQRRQAKLEQQQTARRTARTRQLLAIGLVVVVVVAGIGLVVANNRAERSAAAAAAEQFDCTEVAQETDYGGGQHLDFAALAANPPSELYQNTPASAGPHIGSVTASGVYDETVDERLVVHNLEHGYVAFWWDPDAPQETIDAVTQFVDDNLDEYPKLVAAPYNADLPAEQAVTMVAWTFRQSCAGGFSPQVAQAFIDDHYGLAGVAPEKNLEPHSAGGQGVIDPAEEGGPLLYPPLGQEGGTDPVPSASAPAGQVDEDSTTVTDPTPPAG
jgi:hypothetical protein